MCSSLPLDGVNDKDYEAHVEKYHVSQSMKEIEQKWSVFSAAQNLPAVLNDPSRGRQSNLFTKKWGDSFVERSSVPDSSRLPKIEWKHFDAYCSKIGKRYQRHEKIKQYPDNTAPTPQSLSPSSSISSLQLHESSINGNTNNNNYNIRAYNEQLLHETTTRDIPQIFLKQDLDLSEPSTYALVFSGLNINIESEHRNLQDKLSHYLDIVEIQIAKQVSWSLA